MKFESVPKSAANTTEQAPNPNEELVNETFSNLERFANTSEGKEVLKTAPLAKDYNPDGTNYYSRGEYAKGNEKYESLAEQEGGISEILKEKIGANERRVKEILSDMGHLTERQKDLVRAKLKEKLSHVFFSGAMMGALSFSAAFVRHVQFGIEHGKELASTYSHTTEGQLLSVLAIVGAVSVIPALALKMSGEDISKIKDDIDNIKKWVKSKINDSIESDQSESSDINSEDLE